MLTENFPRNFHPPNICKMQVYKMNINKLEQMYHQRSFMPTIVCCILTFSDNTGTVSLSLISYILLMWELCLTPYIILQLNTEKNDTVRTLIGLIWPWPASPGTPIHIYCPRAPFKPRPGIYSFPKLCYRSSGFWPCLWMDLRPVPYIASLLDKPFRCL